MNASAEATELQLADPFVVVEGFGNLTSGIGLKSCTLSASQMAAPSTSAGGTACHRPIEAITIGPLFELA